MRTTESIDFQLIEQNQHNMRYIRHGVATIPNTICRLRIKYISRVTFYIHLLNMISGHTRINIYIRT